jgi:hypothetical protein
VKRRARTLKSLKSLKSLELKAWLRATRRLAVETVEECESRAPSVAHHSLEEEREKEGGEHEKGN